VSVASGTTGATSRWVTADRTFSMFAWNFSRACIFAWKRRLRTSSRGETYRPATIRVSRDVAIEIRAVVPHEGIQSGMGAILARHELGAATEASA
jgi:hypothetical protein